MCVALWTNFKKKKREQQGVVRTTDYAATPAGYSTPSNADKALSPEEQKKSLIGGGKAKRSKVSCNCRCCFDISNEKVIDMRIKFEFQSNLLQGHLKLDLHRFVQMHQIRRKILNAGSGGGRKNSDQSEVDDAIALPDPQTLLLGENNSSDQQLIVSASGGGGENGNSPIDKQQQQRPSSPGQASEKSE